MTNARMGVSDHPASRWNVCHQKVALRHPRVREAFRVGLAQAKTAQNPSDRYSTCGNRGIVQVERPYARQEMLNCQGVILNRSFA